MEDKLLIKFLLKEADNEEQTAVKRWVKANPANETYFNQLEKIWNANEALQLPAAVDVNEAWTKFKIKADAHSPALPARLSFTQKYPLLRIAAILVVAIGSWVLYTLIGTGSYTELAPSNAIVTKVLPDGSEITINKFSELSYANNFKHNRNIKLKKGEVFFKVAPDKSHPFVIEIDQVEVEVVGTSFNIKHLSKQTEIVVESGIVKVMLEGKSISLVKGERILINEKTKVLQKESSTNQLYQYYRTRLFTAVNTPLEELVSVLNEAYGSQIVLDDAVKKITFNSTLELGSLEQNLQIISQALQLQITHRQDEILLSKK